MIEHESDLWLERMWAREESRKSRWTMRTVTGRF